MLDSDLLVDGKEARVVGCHLWVAGFPGAIEEHVAIKINPTISHQGADAIGLLRQQSTAISTAFIKSAPVAAAPIRNRNTSYFYE
jgi:hypothetical protein